MELAAWEGQKATPEVGLCIACSARDLEQQARSELQKAQLVLDLFLQEQILHPWVAHILYNSHLPPLP